MVFDFKFEKLLRIKDKLLQEKMFEILSLKRSIAQLRNELDGVVLERKRLQGEMTRLVSGGTVDVERIMFVSGLLDSLERKATDIRKHVNELDKMRHQKIEEAKSLRIEKKKFEKLREAYLERYVENVKKEEMKVIDEVGVIEYSRFSG